MARLTISLLGSFQVTLGGEPVTDFATDKARALLAYLAVESDRPHRREALAGLLWPDQPERKARHSLRQALSHLRQAIGDDEADSPFLRVSRDAVRFEPESDYELDVTTFETFIAASRTHHHRSLGACRACVGRLHRAVELYRGDLLAGFYVGDSSLFEEWLLLKGEWLQRGMVEALAHLADYHERRGDYGLARQYAWRQAELEPWREEAQRQLMRLLALEGQRSAALAQYRACRQALDDELGVAPTAETVRLYEGIRSGEGLQPPSPAHNLPPAPTPFVGREDELAELAEMLANPNCRLITLVGPGGVGKTRLALRAAADQVGGFDHGVYFVPLASVLSADLIVSSIADALKFPFSGDQTPRVQLLNHLRQKEMLLVLDNLEHLLEGGALLAEILRQAPEVVLLVTSRERLKLQEEWIYALEGLRYPQVVPEPGSAGSKGLENYSAVRLFLQVAQRLQRHFRLSEIDVPHVARICQIVEGMPLGVELAGAWVPSRTCGEIAQEIERNLDVSPVSLRNVPERHRSLRAAFEHSWGLLSEPEQVVFARLSVFWGGFQREAAERVTDASVDVLTDLVHKSLLRRGALGRYQVHQLLRQYASDKLPSLSESKEALGRAHAEYYAAFVQSREPALKGEGQRQTLAELKAEIDNLRAAWEWAIRQQQFQIVDRALVGLALFYEMQGLHQEGEAAMGQAVEALSQAGPPTPGRTLLGRALARQGAFACRLSDYDKAKRLLRGAIDGLEDSPEAAYALNYLGEVARLQGDCQGAEAFHRRALDLCQQSGDEWELAICFTGLGSVAYRLGDYDGARDHYQQSLLIWQKLGDQGGVSHALNNLGLVIYRLGDYEMARQLLTESLAIKEKLQDRGGIPQVMLNLGNIADVLGEYAEAKRWYEQSLAIRREIGERWGIATVLNNLGVVAHRLGDYGLARRFHQESKGIYQQLDSQWGISNGLNNLGLVAEALGQFDRAEGLYRQALTLRETIKDRRGVGWSFYHLGYLAYQRERYGAAAERLQKSLEIWQELGDPWGLLFAMNAWGQTAIALGELDEARTLLSQVLQKSMAQRTVAVALRALVGWAMLLVQEGQGERAVEILSLVQGHPASEGQTKDQAKRVQARLVSRLSPQAVAAARQRGESTTLEEVVAGVLGA